MNKQIAVAVLTLCSAYSLFGQGTKFSRHTIGESTEAFKTSVRADNSCDDKTAQTYNVDNCIALDAMTPDKFTITSRGTHLEYDFKDGKLVRILLEPGLMTGQNLFSGLVHLYGDPTSTQNLGEQCFTGALAKKLKADIIERWTWKLSTGTVVGEEYCKADQAGPMYRVIIQ